MGLINLLRKLGIFRFGVTNARYSNAKERPIQFQESGVFNAEKDLIYNSEKKRKK